MSHENSIGMLIDADNSPASKIADVLDELANFGVINIRRAYGNWKSNSLAGWEAVLHEYAIQPIQQFAYSKGKNATDMALAIDAMDMLYTKHLSGVALVSSDSDFTPLVMRLRANGLQVYGFGDGPRVCMTWLGEYKNRRLRASQNTLPSLVSVSAASKQTNSPAGISRPRGAPSPA